MWARHSASVREVMEALNSVASRPRAYTTYMTVMTRLKGKGLLGRRREGKTDIYTPVLTRERYLELRAQIEVHALVERFGDIALAHFAHHVDELDPAHLRELRALPQEGSGDDDRQS